MAVCLALDEQGALGKHGQMQLYLKLQLISIYSLQILGKVASENVSGQTLEHHDSTKLQGKKRMGLVVMASC